MAQQGGGARDSRARRGRGVRSGGWWASCTLSPEPRLSRRQALGNLRRAPPCRAPKGLCQTRSPAWSGRQGGHGGECSLPFRVSGPLRLGGGAVLGAASRSKGTGGLQGSWPPPRPWRRDGGGGRSSPVILEAEQGLASLAAPQLARGWCRVSTFPSQRHGTPLCVRRALVHEALGARAVSQYTSVQVARKPSFKLRRPQARGKEPSA